MGSPLRRVFEPPQMVDFIPAGGFPHAGDVYDVYIECSEQQAMELLEIAKQHCPGAVYPIQEALRLVGSSHH
jgi:hypothetical protein